jgi:hydrogenase small subunit
VDDVLISKINLVYHTTLMGATGDLAISAAEEAYNKGGYVLVVEGGVPTAFNGAACVSWNYNGQDVTFLDAVQDLSTNASQILCFGTCASFGGMAAAAPNPTMVKGVRQIVLKPKKPIINISGCPPHPDWMVWAIVQLLLGKSVSLDKYGRPVALYNTTVHERCPRREAEETSSWGVDGRCLEELGCRGPEAKASCVSTKWNNGVNWCMGAGAPCIGCTDPEFPGRRRLVRSS